MKFYKDANWVIAFATIAVALIAFIALYHSCQNDLRNAQIEDEDRYERSAVELRPKVRLGNVKCEHILPLEFNISHDRKEHVSTIGIIPSIYLSVDIMNEGNCNARIISGLIGCSKSKESIARKMILGKEKSYSLNLENIIMDEDFFEKRVLQPDDIITRKVRLEKLPIDSSGFIILHNILIYENDLGIMFDTYLKLRLKFDIFKLYLDPYGIVYSEEDVRKSLQISEVGPYDSKFYSLKEKEAAQPFIEKGVKPK